MKGKKLIALALCLLLTISLLPVSVLADGEPGENTPPAASDDTTPPAASNDTTPPADDGDGETNPPADDDDGETTPPVDGDDGNTNPPADDDEPGDPDPAIDLGDANPADLDPNALLNGPDGLMGTTETEYYLHGSRNGWNVSQLSSAVKFSPNPDNSSEYMLNITLTEGEEFKVVTISGSEVAAWYPSSGSNYVVDANHAGDVTVYFRPDYQGGDDWYEHTIFVPAQPTKYSVNIRDINPNAAAGTVTATPNRAAEGETVTLTITENAGYKVRSVGPQIYYNGWSSCQTTKVDRLTFTFMMPAADVNVDTTFDAATPVRVTLYDTTTGRQVKSDAGGTVVVSPDTGFENDIVTVTITTNPGYRIDTLYIDSTWTFISENGNVTVYEKKLPYGNYVSVYFTQNMADGYYLQMVGQEGQDDYHNWTLLSKFDSSNPNFISTQNEMFYLTKKTLTVGQVLNGYHLTFSNQVPTGEDTPIATYTVAEADVVAGQQSTVYLDYAAARSYIGVSALTGYYLVFTYPKPYNVQAAHELTLQNGVYINEATYHAGDRVRVAHFSEGTITQVFLNGTTPQYQVPDPDGFPGGTYGVGGPGRAWFLPDGSGGEDYLGGYVKIRRLYSVTTNAPDNCTFTGLHNTEPVGDTVSFTVTVSPNQDGYKYVLDQVTVTDGDGNDVDVTEENGVWSFTMPAADVTVTVTIAEKQYEHVALENEDEITHGTVEIKTEYPDDNSCSYPGDTVTVKLTPEQGYQVGHFSVRINGSAPVDTLPVTGPDEQGRYTFVMPNYEVLIHVTFMVPDGYYLVKVPSDGHINEVLDVYENGLGAFENDSYVFILKENLEADDEEYMLTGVTLTEGDMLWVVKVEDGVIKNWDGGDRPKEDDSYMYQVDANHANADTDPMIAIEIYFRPETPDPDQHPGWAAFGDHLFIAIARDIHVTPADSEAFVSFITPSEPKAVYTATVHFRVTPADGYRLLSGPTVTYGDNGSAEVTYDANNDEYTFTMPDCEVNLNVQFCLEDGYYLNGSMNEWNLANITPAMKFQENTGVDGEYKLMNWVFASTDEFKVVKLVNGTIPVDPNNPSYEWYGTSLSNHTGENGNYVINDQAGTKTVYFRPTWYDAWSGHIWIGEEVPAPYFMTEGMNLSTAIEVRFNLIMPGGADAYPDSYMTFTIQYKDGNIFEMDTADAVAINDYDGLPRYRFYCPINAIQMADKITPVFHYKGGNGEWVEVTREPFSAKDYLEKALNDGTGAITDGLRALALATADYGHYAQLYLQTIHSENSYGEHNEMPRYGTGSFDYDATYAAVEACAIVRNPVGDIESIAFSLYCDSTTGIKLYPTMKEGYAQAPTATYNGVTEELVLSGDEPREYVYKMAGVKPSGMAKMRTVKLSDGTKSTKVKVAVLSWVRLTLNNEKPRSDEQKDFACAIYNYNQAALNAN